MPRGRRPSGILSCEWHSILHTHEEFRFCEQIVFFSSHLEISLLFCLRYFRYCTHAFEVQCFRVRHRAVYRSWRVNSHEPLDGNLELEAVIAAKDFLDLHWWKQSSKRYNHRHQQVGNPQETPRGQIKSSSTLVVWQTRRNKSVLLFQLRSEQFVFHVK